MAKYLHVQAKGRNIPYPSIKIAICECSSHHSYGKIGSCQTKYPHQWNSISSPSCHIKNPPSFRAKIPSGIITIWINNLQIQGTSIGFLSQLFLSGITTGSSFIPMILAAYPPKMLLSYIMFAYSTSYHSQYIP